CLIGNAVEFEREREFNALMRGRDLKTGLPKMVKATPKDIRDALKGPVQEIIAGVKDAIEDTPAELIADVVKNGMVLAGGTALLRGIDRLMAHELKIPVRVAKDPLTCVVRGCGKLLDDAILLKTVRIK
ncbi:rod shape-determining protein, partial [Patescibacteria group bacterium]|nr:rod shape-determining protein [Patescibacteria group bacterium]